MTPDEIMALTDDELDCAVAVAQGWTQNAILIPYWANQGKYVIDVADYHPSRDGNQLLEIMAREKISVLFDKNINNWVSTKSEKYLFVEAQGNTINQAVLRCYLASKQGVNNG